MKGFLLFFGQHNMRKRREGRGFWALQIMLMGFGQWTTVVCFSLDSSARDREMSGGL
jgi:hypothetical protein